MKFLAKILVYPKEGVLDTQGKAVARSLKRIGFESLKDARIGKFIQVWIDTENSGEALSVAEAMCSELLVNDLIEDRAIEIEECEQ
ncbi:MAG TPA: phosphoribosylformylglycinamidine synthase subunit PurS [Synergistales bacterium]|jgi:phosphoribosylformylglycinamidine synthase PurS subunit|nr:phosphoribosylformylglycinamidine synthase subunit PurS [Synergistales bacterium]HRV70742.1 phosphoribosylformylglycinamidine synthase subunit PurS [Thermovirgaceae bacterium]